jgi:hypothetical protein
MIDTTLTRRSLLKGAAAMTAAAVLPLPALAVEDDGGSTVAAIEEPPTVELPAGPARPWPACEADCTTAEIQAIAIFARGAAALMTDAEVERVAARILEAEDLFVLDEEEVYALVRAFVRRRPRRDRFVQGDVKREAAALAVALSLAASDTREEFARAVDRCGPLRAEYFGADAA